MPVNGLFAAIMLAIYCELKFVREIVTAGQVNLCVFLVTKQHVMIDDQYYSENFSSAVALKSVRCSYSARTLHFAINRTPFYGVYFSFCFCTTAIRGRKMQFRCFFHYKNDLSRLFNNKIIFFDFFFDFFTVFAGGNQCIRTKASSNARVAWQKSRHMPWLPRLHHLVNGIEWSR